ncbi:MAG: SRPBCC family protein [Planctomycetota bacterium]
MFAQVHQLQSRQILPISLEECWDFFSNPMNLPEITPPWLHFDVSEVEFERIRPGAVFQYTVRPLLGVPLSWVTEITHVVPAELFVDEQRFGPYRFWHHQHHFTPVRDGIEVLDIVHYALPLGPIGRIVHALSVKRKLDAIFAYRRDVLERRFGSKRAATR